ncbi:hypothetical protein IWW55_003173 [Coemansia sp. RSA 2706]|nr:hypothetical protein IWW55_003173 [Coemansia sp. RSA 2706]KAJ2314657.1 hypothetical protein IWW54_000793 [Coemansia sp. RSA 2705]KAJ2328984.1 hypothetical protein IWW51_000884 [Coemansia sp. RSA 2702]
MRVSLALALAIAAASVAALPLGTASTGISGGLSRMDKRDHIPENGKSEDPRPEEHQPEAQKPKEHQPENQKPEERRPEEHRPEDNRPREPEHPPANEHHDSPPPKPDHPADNHGSHPEPNNQPVHQHFEHTEHPNNNPNDIDHFSHDIVNTDKVHSNIVQHVSMSGNNINGRPSGQVVEGGKGIVINGKGNKVFTDGVVHSFGPGGFVFAQGGDSDSNNRVAPSRPDEKPHGR